MSPLDIKCIKKEIKEEPCYTREESAYYNPYDSSTSTVILTQKPRASCSSSNIAQGSKSSSNRKKKKRKRHNRSKSKRKSINKRQYYKKMSRKDRTARDRKLPEPTSFAVETIEIDDDLAETQNLKPEVTDFKKIAEKLFEFSIDSELITLLTGVKSTEISLLNSLDQTRKRKTESNYDLRIKQELIDISDTLSCIDHNAARKRMKQLNIDPKFIEEITGLKIGGDSSTIDLTDEKPSTSFQRDESKIETKMEIDLVSDEDEPISKKFKQEPCTSSQTDESTKKATKRIKTETKTTNSYNVIDLDSDEEVPQKKRCKEEPSISKIKTEIEDIQTTNKKKVVKKEEPSTSKIKTEIKDTQTNKKKAVKKVKTEVKTENCEESLENVPKTKKKSTKKSETTDQDIESKPKASKKTSTKTLKSIKTELKFGVSEQWRDEDLLAEKEKVQTKVARALINLFDEGNTVPFIARYRRHLTDDMSAEIIRKAKDTYDEIVEIKTKRSSMINTLEKSGKLTRHLQKSVLACKSIEELEHVYAPYKPTAKKSLAERAKNLGLEEPAVSLLHEGKEIDPRQYIRKYEEELCSLDKVEKYIIHLLAHMIAHDSEVLAFLRELIEKVSFLIQSSLSTSATKGENKDKIHKFELYFGKKISTHTIQPHQVLAINRGESLKILSVKVIIPDFVNWRFKDFCEKKWMKNSAKYSNRFRLFQEAVKETYSKSISPYLSRKIRSELKNTAHKASIEVFAQNIQKLLLQPPIKGKIIMGIDPGLKVGCKIAVISSLGEVLDTSAVYPHTTKNSNSDAEVIRSLLLKHNCSLIAIGNGTACRETENWLTRLINKDYFNPLNVSYTIVEESGASVYSCSDEAKKEFPNMDPLHIGAVSLARRIQDPLAELIKIDPKSLGVGMYQHDLNQKLLDNTLNEVISECVSFVGVDLNTASHCLLRRVAGLSNIKAENIIKHRQKNGPFTNRYQLKDVKGIGEKIFEQCSGFLRIMPSSSEEAVKFYERPETTPLDATDIHPEDYPIAEKMIEKFNLRFKHIGLPCFIKQFEQLSRSIPIDKLAKEYNSTEQSVNLVISALSKPLAYDLRTDNKHGPIFKKDITRFEDLKPNLILTGRVTNVVHFGAFVDIGVGHNGLLHIKYMQGKNITVGSRVEVKVLGIDGHKIPLDLVKIL